MNVLYCSDTSIMMCFHSSLQGSVLTDAVAQDICDVLTSNTSLTAFE